METQELRLALRMAREAFEERSVDLEERFKGLAAGRGKEEPAEGKEEPSSPKKGGAMRFLIQGPMDFHVILHRFTSFYSILLYFLVSYRIFAGFQRPAKG